MNQTASSKGLVACDTCGLVCKYKAGCTCPRCSAPLHQRQPYSLQKTWAFLITATIFLFPANFSPITILINRGNEQPDTIMSGVLALARSDMLPIAIIVFVASIVVPVGKILAMVIVLISVQFKLPLSHRSRLSMFLFIDWIGRWSMLDLFVISLMVAVLDKGQLLAVVPGPAATAFGIVVIMTLFAARSFDTRLMWDQEKDISYSRLTPLETTQNLERDNDRD